MRNGQKFCIDLLKKCKESQGENVLFSRGYDVTYARLETYNLLKPHLNTKKLCTRLFLHKIDKNTS